MVLNMILAAIALVDPLRERFERGVWVAQIPRYILPRPRLDVFVVVFHIDDIRLAHANLSRRTLEHDASALDKF